MLFNKKQIASPVSGANVRIRLGLFGNGSPATSAVNEVQSNANSSGIYSYYEGDIFTPGAEAFVFVPNFELPLVTVWGMGFIRNPNTFSPRQPTQLLSNPNVVTNGLGGQMAGQIIQQPLLANEGGNM